MDTQCAEVLISIAADQLVATGTLPDHWSPDYMEVLDAVRMLNRGTVWPKRLFWTLHFASMHLCLRYYAWSRRSSCRNDKTEAILHDIQLSTELFFWSSLVDIHRSTAKVATDKDHSALTHTEAKLLELCFGQASPVDDADNTLSLERWRLHYEQCLHDIRDRYMMNELWPKSVSVAIHFASFYLDLYLQRELDLDEKKEVHRTSAAAFDRVVSDLSILISNTRVVRLIELWLASTSETRDASGLPIIGNARVRRQPLMSVRTVSELFIQLAIQSQ